MGIYAHHILPWMIDRAMRNKVMAQHRPRVPALAVGRVLELGAGAGLNLGYYSRDVQHLFALEPAGFLRQKIAQAAESAALPVTLLASGAEDLPLERASIDTVVSTWTLCSIPDVSAALRECRRVLKPGGQLLFMEHGRAPDDSVARLQDRLAPAFQALAGCSPNRPMENLIREAGFSLTAMERAYLDGPRFIAYHYIGAARPA